MKKSILAAVLSLFFVAPVMAADTYTTRSGLVKPEEGSTSWGPKIRANYDIIDSSFALLSGTQTFTGTNTFLSSTFGTGIFDRVLIATPTYVTAGDELAVSGDVRIGGGVSGGSLYVCDQNFQNCSLLSIGNLTLSNTGSTSVVVRHDTTASGGLQLKSAYGASSITNANAPNVFSADRLYVGATYGDRVANTIATTAGISAFEDAVYVGTHTLSATAQLGIKGNTSNTYVVTFGTSPNNTSYMLAISTPGIVLIPGQTSLNGLTYTWPASQGGNQYLRTDGSGGLSWSTVASGGGGASSLQVMLSGVEVSSPTGSLNLYGGDFIAIADGTTAQIYLNPSTTNYIHAQSTLQSGATFYTSSGTVNTFNIGTSIRWPDGTIQISSPTAGGSSTVLTSSGVAYGSATSTPTASPSDFMYDQTGNTVQIGTSTLNSTTMSGAGLRVWAKSPSSLAPLRIANPFDTTYIPFVSYIGSGSELDYPDSQSFSITQQATSGDVTFAATASASGSSVFRFKGLTSGGNFFEAGTSSQSVKGPFTVGGISVCLEDGTDCPASGAGDMILASTQTVTGSKTFVSSTSFSGAVYVSSSILLSGAIGTNGQVLTTGGPGTVPTWTTVSGSGGGDNLGDHVSTKTVTANYGLVVSTVSAGNITSVTEEISSKLTVSSSALQGSRVLVDVSAAAAGAGSSGTMMKLDSAGATAFGTLTGLQILADANAVNNYGLHVTASNGSSVNDAIYVAAGNVNIQGLDASSGVCTDGSKRLTTTGCSFGGDNLGSGVGSYGVSTTTGGFTGAGGVTVTYGVVAGSVTVGGQSVCLEDGTDCPVSSGGGDNFGNHIATKTVTAGYGISATTAAFSDTIQTEAIDMLAGFYLGMSGQSGVRFFDANSSDNIQIAAPTNVTAYSLSLPDAQGAADSYLKNNGSGVLSWSTIAGGGDAVLASTQSWTGGNVFNSYTTFVGSVTVGNVLVSSAPIVEIPISAASLKGTSVTGAGDASQLAESSATITNAVNSDYMKFTDGAISYAYFNYSLPPAFDSSKLTFKTVWTSTGSVASSSATWCLQGVALADADAIDTAYGTAQCFSDVTVGTNTIHVSPESSSITLGNSWASGDSVHWRIYRDPTQDNLPMDARLMEIRIRYKRNSYTD